MQSCSSIMLSEEALGVCTVDDDSFRPGACHRSFVRQQTCTPQRPSMSYLSHAERQLARNARHLNAFISRSNPTQCQAAIKAAAERIRLGNTQSAIDGRTFAIKDNICTDDLPTTCASNILQDFRSPFDATVVRRIRDAGGVIVGKTNLDEFGMGSHNINSVSGSVLNPHGGGDLRLSAGGSSGGSAAAVAADTCDIALGTDTGGSVRLPAAYCQVIGFKPSYGRISRFGVIAYANSLDTVGLIGKDAEALRQVFQVLDVPDRHDPTCLGAQERALLRKSSNRGGSKRKFKIGVPLQYNIQELDSRIRETWQKVAFKFMEDGHEVVSVDLPATSTALAAYYILAPAEASSNLAKYDGVRYGKPSAEPRSEEDVLFARTRSEGLGAEVRRRILLGSYSLSSTAMDNYFIQAQKVRRQIQQEFNGVFASRHPLQDEEGGHMESGVDLLLTPTAPTLPPLLADAESRSPVEGYRDDVYTVPASLAGLPAISVPVRIDDQEQAAGMQLVGQYGDDELVLDAASLLEKLSV